MTLDRKDYKSAIPQLEKRLSAVEGVGKKGLANFDILKDLIEKEVNERIRTYKKQDTSINTITVKMYYLVCNTGVTPTPDTAGWSETMPKLDSTNDDKVLWYMSKTFRNGAVVKTSTPQQVQLMDGVFAFINSISGDAGWTTIDGDTISTGRIQDHTGDNYFDLDDGTFNFGDQNGNYVRQVGNGVEINGKLTVGSFDTLQLGGRNLLHGTRELVNGNSGWASGHWRASGSGGTVAYNQTLTNPPVNGVKGIVITPTTANAQIGFTQDYAPIAKREFTQSVWVKGKTGDMIDLQPIWANASGEEEYGSKRYTLANNNWNLLTYTKTPNHDHASVSLGYVYLYAVDTSHTVQFCAPQMEYGNKATEWNPSPEEDAGTATNYITYVSSSDGIKVNDGSASPPSNYVQIKPSGLYLYKGGKEIAYFDGTHAAIGENGKGRSVVMNDGLHVYDYVDGTQREVATFGSIARVGLASDRHAKVTSGGLFVYNGTEDDSHLIAQFGYGAGKNSSGGMSDAPYYTLGYRRYNSDKGNYSVAEGYDTTASRYCSHAFGYKTVCSGPYSIAAGTNTTVSSWQSFAFGNKLTVGYDEQFVIGVRNDNKSTNLFEIGNGSELGDTHSNAFAVDWDGKVLTPQIQGGTIAATSVSGNSYVDKAVTFSPAMSGTPKIVCCIKSDSTSGEIGNLTASVLAGSESANGFTCRIFNGGSSTRVPYVNWIAMNI